MEDPRLIPISALQHFAFCPRQCALIHNEQIWSENFLTAQGRLLHQRVDSQDPETRKGIRMERGVSVCSEKLGLTGKLDLLEIDLKSGTPTPVEYKRGRPKIEDWDRIQLCAQALCLEKMMGVSVEQGALWYWQIRRRIQVPIESDLRERTHEVIEQVRSLLESGLTPKAEFAKKCKACSLFDQCNPQLTSSDQSRRYVETLFSQDEIEL
jgi:CRISPR-associated exonuclease Cas4